MSELALRNADLPYRLRALGMAGAVLHVGSHPDDEEAGLIAWLSRGLGLRTVYWSATRGEGGQNRTGPERAEGLGILRTWESLEARELDGGELLYGPFYDYGFSRSGDDALARWDRDVVVGEIVRAIRLVQPLIVISRWSGGPEDGHGHHQAVGRATGQAFEAAGDGNRFPELAAQGLPPWQSKKLYRSAAGDWQPGDSTLFGARSQELEEAGLVRVNTGAFDPVSGRSFQELAWIGVNRHQSQAMSLLPERGDHFLYYRLDRSLVEGPGREHSFFDGLDPSLTGLADQIGVESQDLRDSLKQAADQAAAAVRAFVPDRPSDAGRRVLEGLTALIRARESIGEVDENRRGALDRYLGRKIAEFEDAAARCLGIDLECLIEEARLTPGRRVVVRARLWSEQPLDETEIGLAVPEGWTAEPLDALPGDEGGREFAPAASASFDVTTPENAELSSPYWLREPRSPYRYAWPESGSAGLPFDEPLVSATCEIGIDGHRLFITRRAFQRETFVGGSRELPPRVVPPVALRPRERRVLVPVTHQDEALDLQLAARSMREDVAGKLSVDAHSGWDVDPTNVELEFPRIGDVHMLAFELRVPAEAKAGIHELTYRITAGQRDYGVVLQPVRRRAPGLAGPADERNCIAEEFVMAPATVAVHLIEAEFVRRLRYAYIPGADEEILKALEPFGLDVTLLAPEELSYSDLSLFDTIVVGPNAYLVSDDVRRNAARLLEYVERGGTLIVQYQAYGYEGTGWAPHPFRYHQPHDRVTSPEAPVTLLDPDHPVLSVPNRVTPEDFEGWVHDRGLYFFGEWDKRYVPLLESADPGQEPQRGGLVVASHGRGTYVYAAYSFFRQIPEGVPGAIRLFANLLGLAEARILERVERVRHLSLFSFMKDPQLYEVARLMSERWPDAGEYLCHRGDRGRELYIVLDGGIEVIKGEEGAEMAVHVAGPGEVVGELSVLTDLPRSATLRAANDTKILVMRGTHFREFLREHAGLSERVMSLLARELGSAEIMW